MDDEPDPAARSMYCNLIDLLSTRTGQSASRVTATEGASTGVNGKDVLVIAGAGSDVFAGRVGPRPAGGPANRRHAAELRSPAGEKHYSAWIRARQERLTDRVRSTWEAYNPGANRPKGSATVDSKGV